MLACIRRFIGLISEQEFSALLQSDIRWNDVSHLILAHRIVGPALGGLLTTDLPPAVTTAVSRLKALRVANALRSLFLAEQLINLSRLLHSNGIPAICFKGPILSLDAYGDAAIRATGDLDLLIHREQMPKARELLIARGFAPIFPTSTPAEANFLRSLSNEHLARYINSHSEHHLMQTDGRVNVDLHWDIALRQFALPLDSHRLWQNARTVKLSDGEIQTLGMEDLLLVLCINAAKDCWARFDRICDVAAVVCRNPAIDFDSLICASRKAGACRMVLVTLLIARELLHLPLPVPIAREVAADPYCPRLAAEFARRMFGDNRANQPSRLDEAVTQLRARDQIRSRLRYLIGQCYPTVGDWSALPLPASLSFLHVLLRPLRLMLQVEGKAR
jgi:hypothetical protein